MSELKPCPFCGGEPELMGGGETSEEGACWWVRCHACGCSQGVYLLDDSGVEAIEAWNRRAQSSTQTPVEVGTTVQAGQMLTDERLNEIFRESFKLIDSRMTPQQLQFARAIEQAVLAKRVPMTDPQLKRVHPLDMPLDVFIEDLPTRPRRIIKDEMMYFTHSGDEYIKPPFTVRHLLMFSRSEMRKWPNLGKKSLNEIEELLRNRGLQLWEQHDERSLKFLRQHPTYWIAPQQAQNKQEGR